MPKTAITVQVEVRDDREAAQVKNALEHILSLNGATGALNLYDELQGTGIAAAVLRNGVEAIAKKFRKRDR